MNSAITAFVDLFGAVEQDPDQELPLAVNIEQKTEAGTVRPLSRLPPGAWRSLGRHLDYTNWADRERFLELDRAIRTSSS